MRVNNPGLLTERQDTGTVKPLGEKFDVPLPRPYTDVLHFAEPHLPIHRCRTLSFYTYANEGLLSMSSEALPPFLLAETP